MRGIKHVLTERFYTWEDAVKLAEDDPEVDLSGEGTPFTPSEYLENEGLDDVREEELTGEERKALEEARDSETREDKEHTAGQGQKSQGITELDPSTIPASKPNQDSPRA
ncbi:hypothetical protein GQ53DRAFT_747992 [Thozetella sp. PMI_491]|nr:hypothetical protein GQ53DRAFT_747992 [Thozetella sp. PMI_491]